MGSLNFSAQYQQQPVPIDGNLIKRDWIKWYDGQPNRGDGGQVFQSWDLASTMEDGRDYSVCSTWLAVKRRYYLLDVWRGRSEFPQLKRKLIQLAHEHKPNCILIEKAGPGLHLIQELRTNPVTGVPLPIGVTPQGDKLVRMEAQCARFEAGQVFLPREAAWLAEFLHEILSFPRSRYDDQIDTVSQFLKHAEARSSASPFDLSMIGTTVKIFCDGRTYGTAEDL
jgi:predicted phage terminase large subunit-like protein